MKGGATFLDLKCSERWGCSMDVKTCLKYYQINVRLLTSMNGSAKSVDNYISNIIMASRFQVNLVKNEYRKSITKIVSTWCTYAH